MSPEQASGMMNAEMRIVADELVFKTNIMMSKLKENRRSPSIVF